jgi:hypothetical protein
MRGQTIWYTIILVSFFIISTFFTNCASQFNIEPVNSASVGRTIDSQDSPHFPNNFPNGSDQPQDLVDFREGEVITKSKLASINPRLEAFFDNYFSADSLKQKAIAVTYDYQGVFGFYGYNLGVDSAIEYAISVCNARYQKKCVLLVNGNMFKISSAQLRLIKNQNGSAGSETQARLNETFTEGNFSFLRGHEFVRNYINATGLKAMALSWNGNLYSLRSSQSDQASVSRATVELCQIESQFRCVLIAEGNTYAWDYTRHRFNWTLLKAGDDLPNPLNFLPSITNFNPSSYQTLYLNTILNGGKGMIMIVPGKEVFARTTQPGSTETREQMMSALQNSCREKYPENGKDKCILFSENLKVVWNLQDRTNP